MYYLVLFIIAVESMKKNNNTRMLIIRKKMSLFQKNKIKTIFGKRLFWKVKVETK